MPAELAVVAHDQAVTDLAAALTAGAWIIHATPPVAAEAAVRLADLPAWCVWVDLGNDVARVTNLAGAGSDPGRGLPAPPYPAHPGSGPGGSAQLAELVAERRMLTLGL